ncbi:MAG: glycogen/starch synthase, partial [Nitrospirae bacterium]|nr:glycogen/starch synthase [Nitrospirota bacterium]
MNKKLNILFCSSEVTPFSKTGGLGDVAGSLPKALTEIGCQVRVITPKYACVSDTSVDLKKVIDSVTLRIGGRNEECGLYE